MKTETILRTYRSDFPYALKLEQDAVPLTQSRRRGRGSLHRKRLRLLIPAAATLLLLAGAARSESLTEAVDRAFMKGADPAALTLTHLMDHQAGTGLAGSADQAEDITATAPPPSEGERIAAMATRLGEREAALPEGDARYPYLVWAMDRFLPSDSLLYRGAQIMDQTRTPAPLTDIGRAGTFAPREEIALAVVSAYFDYQRAAALEQAARKLAGEQARKAGTTSATLRNALDILPKAKQKAEDRFSALSDGLEVTALPLATLPRTTIPNDRSLILRLAVEANPILSGQDTSALNHDITRAGIDFAPVSSRRSNLVHVQQSGDNNGVGGGGVMRLTFGLAPMARDALPVSSLSVARDKVSVRDRVYERVNVAYTAIWAASLHVPIIEDRLVRAMQKRDGLKAGNHKAAYLEQSDKVWQLTSARIEARFARAFGRYQLLAAIGQLQQEIYLPPSPSERRPQTAARPNTQQGSKG